jgi:hypothetical protein
MKHFIKKISLMGAGKKKGAGSSGPPPDPPRLDPPVYGKYKSYPSYSSAEIVDLICDGPIEGLVNQQGEKLVNENILQGIYLDDTPISSVNNVGSSTATANPFRDVPSSDALFLPLLNFFQDLYKAENAIKITPAKAQNLWDNVNGEKAIPHTLPKENIGVLRSVTETISYIRADGLDEKYKKTNKTINELKKKLDKVDNKEGETRKKFVQKLIDRNVLIEDRDNQQVALAVKQSELDALPNNKANKKARSNKQDEIDKIEGKIKELNGKIAKLDKEVAALDIDGKEDFQEVLIQKRQTEQLTLNRLNEELKAIPKGQKQNIKNKNKEIDASKKIIKDYDARIKSLEKQLEKLGNFNVIEKYEKQIDQQEEILEGIKFDWTPIDNSQKLDRQDLTLAALVSQGKLTKNEYPDGGPPSYVWAGTAGKLQLHFRNATAYGPSEYLNIYWWKNHLNGLITQLENDNLIFERDYVYKVLKNITRIEKQTIINKTKKSSDINKTYDDYTRYEEPLLIYTIGTRTDGISFLKSGASVADRKVDMDDMAASFYIDNVRTLEGLNVYTCLIPRTIWQKELNADNPLYTGGVYGFIAISFDNSIRDDGLITWLSNKVSYSDIDVSINMNNFIGRLAAAAASAEIFTKNAKKSKYDIRHEMRIYKTPLNSNISQPLTTAFNLKFDRSFIRFVLNKYNFNNILNEFRNGEEDQKPLAFFNSTPIDVEASYKLTGPFRKEGAVRKFNPARALMLDVWPSSHFSSSPGDVQVGGTPSLTLKLGGEGGQDIRSYKKGDGSVAGNTKFHSTLDAFNEDPVPYTYYIENPDVEEIIVTIEIKQLSDMLSTPTILSEDSDEKVKDQPGTKIPAILQIRVETGYVVDGTFNTATNRDIRIVGLIESPVLIDLGNQENKYFEDKGAYKAGYSVDSKFAGKGPYVGSVGNSNDNNPSKKIILPTLTNALISRGAKRYVKVYKVSAETNSVLIRRDLYVNKITEIVPFNFSYPFSAIVGSKIDARNFTTIPNRSFDCRLKKILIPSNYFPLREFPNKDKRYYESVADYNATSTENKLIYRGDWNGDLKLGWTDNPAWILYDILTNIRYGLGEYLENSSINIWEIYKIGRYCDAVNDDGLFVGVKDLYGGLEPRFSCNIMFNETTKIFDAVNTITSLFRGNVFFSNSELHFSDDRPREPIALFTNSNVKDGFFNYTNNKKDESFNVVEVAYIDKLDNYKTKIEIVKDEDDIRYRGYAKTVINTFGVTSKSMARRIGQHVIWQTTKENQGVEFTSGPEALLCRPGDLVVVEDEMKSRTTNYGRILDVDPTNRALTLDNPVDLLSVENKITVYTPTGYKTASELERLSDEKRKRIDKFQISNTNLTWTKDRVFQFSKYSKQYLPQDIYKTTGYQQAIYLDRYDKNYCWYYDLPLSGWVMSISGEFATDGQKYISEVTDDGVQDINNLYAYLPTTPNKRGALQQASPSYVFKGTNWIGVLSGQNSVAGIHDDEIRTQNNRQITTYSVSQVSPLSSDTEISNGSIVYLNASNFNLSLLNIIEPGSTYRLQVKNTQDQIYKVISIRENSSNEYSIVATKYDSGKWNIIENDVYIENPQQQYNSTLFKVVDAYASPENLTLDFSSRNETNFSLVGEWYAPSKEAGLTYSVYLENPNIGFFNEQVIQTSTTDIGPYKIYYSGLNDQGLWTFKAQVISKNTLKYNSFFSTTRKFIGLENSNPDDLSSPVVAMVKAI